MTAAKAPEPVAHSIVPEPGTRAVVLDTNALFLPFTEGTDLEGQLFGLLGATQWFIPSSVLIELGSLVHKGEGTLARNAKMALKYAQRCAVQETKLPGDDGLLEVARRLKAVVVTNDRKLQAEAAQSGLTVIVAREHGRLAMRGGGSS